MSKIYLGAGCFWGVQAYIDQVPGVLSSRVGYMGGRTSEPTYEQVCSSSSGHAEVVEVEYDEEQVSSENIVRHFFMLHDPTQLDRQGPDIGDQYRSVLFFTNTAQKSSAEKIAKELSANFEQPIVTKIIKAEQFWPAEEYHQKYFEKTGRGMCHVDYAPLSKTT